MRKWRKFQIPSERLEAEERFALPTQLQLKY